VNNTQNVPLKTIAEAAPIAPKNGEYAGYLSSDMTIFQQHGTKRMKPFYPSLNFSTVRNNIPVGWTGTKLLTEVGPSYKLNKSGLQQHVQNDKRPSTETPTLTAGSAEHWLDAWSRADTPLAKYNGVHDWWIDGSARFVTNPRRYSNCNPTAHESQWPYCRLAYTTTHKWMDKLGCVLPQRQKDAAEHK